MGKPKTSTRVTEVADTLTSGWKYHWAQYIEKTMLPAVAKEAAEFSRQLPSEEDWLRFLSSRTAMSEVNRVSVESTEFGTGVHAVVEAYLLGTPTPRTATKRQLFCGNMIIDWCKQAKVKPILLGGKPAIECSLVSKELSLTGHPDLICTFGDDPTVWIVDWKTSKEMRREYILQMSAYAMMVREMYGLVINNGVIVRVPSDPNVTPQFEVHPVIDLGLYEKAFLSALDAVNFFNRRASWKEVA